MAIFTPQRVKKTRMATQHMDTFKQFVETNPTLVIQSAQQTTAEFYQPVIQQLPVYA